MKVLVIGGNGFIGRSMVQWLLCHHHHVVILARSQQNIPKHPHCHIEITDAGTLTSPNDWIPFLDKVDAVINCMGVLEASDETFDRLHCKAPHALAIACSDLNIKALVQLSAMGDSSSGEFIASKHRGDQLMATAFTRTRIVRPSVVMSTSGSFGGTSLMRAVAALPILPLPKHLKGRFQPILLEDLCEIMGRLLTCKDDKQFFYPAMKEPYELVEFFQDLRQWLGWKPAHVLLYPKSFFSFGLWLNRQCSWIPFNKTLLEMLESGNLVEEQQRQATIEATGYPIRSVKSALASTASFVQDRWHAKLYWLYPLCLLSLFLIWTISGFAGWFAHAEQYSPILNALHVPASFQAKSVLIFSLWDWLLALGLLINPVRTFILYLMLASTLGYSILIGLLAPFTWMDLLGGLIKNIAVIGVISCCLMLKSHR